MSQICSICEKAPVEAAFKPFCSKRCADIDLGRWLKGGYAIPTHERPSQQDLGEPAEILPYRNPDDA